MLAALAASEAASDDVSEILTEAAPCLRRVLARFRVPHEDQEDLLQDVFVAFILKRESIRKPEAWLQGALRRICCQYWRRTMRRRRVEHQVMEWEEPAAAPEPDTGIDLRRRLAHLSPGARQVLHLRYWAGCNDAEIAAATTYAPGSVDTTLRRGLATLKTGWRS